MFSLSLSTKTHNVNLNQLCIFFQTLMSAAMILPSAEEGIVPTLMVLTIAFVIPDMKVVVILPHAKVSGRNISKKIV